MTRRAYILLALSLMGIMYCFFFFYEVEGGNDKSSLKANNSASLNVTTTSALVSRAPELREKMQHVYVTGRFVTKSLPELNVPVIQVLDELKAQAQGGNFHAACRLGFELDRCALYYKDKKALEEMRASIEKLPSDALKIPSYQRMIPKIQKAVEKLNSVCEGVPAQELSASSSYLLQAANAGQMSATVRYLHGIGLDWDAGPLANTADWTKFSENFAPLLARSINDGSPEALEIAAIAYLKPTFGAQLMPVDPVKAITYYFALELISAPGYKDVIQSRILSTIKEHNLSSVQVASARANSNSISAKIIKVPAGGIDFSKGTFFGETGQHCEE